MPPPPPANTPLPGLGGTFLADECRVPLLMEYNCFSKSEKIPCGFIELWKVDRVLGGTAGRRGIRRGGLHFFSRPEHYLAPGRIEAKTPFSRQVLADLVFAVFPETKTDMKISSYITNRFISGYLSDISLHS